MFSHHGGFGIAQQPLQHVFGGGDRLGAAGEFRKKRHRLGDLPADKHRGQQIIAVLGQSFGKLVFEILDPLIESMNHLDSPGQTALYARLGENASGIAEGRDDDNFRLPNLKGEQQQAENQDQQNSNDQSEGASFHGD